MPTNSQDHNKMDSKLVGKNILVMVEENEQLTIPTFIAFVRQEFGYTITYRKAWLAKQWALEQVYGNWEESYNILLKYLQALQLFVPGTIVRIQTIPTNHSQTRYKGTLLDIVAQDGANNIFPLAFAIVEGYAMTQPEFFHHYRELQEDNPHDTTRLDQIPREQWTLA
ncbi:hypothetical protein JHK84_050751 [Glycine max]|nr:hypothetical protein JHK85_051557 [Glycine max]KAG5095163.1 hypothetical protein JHK84_050751 [Glycine max]